MRRTILCVICLAVIALVFRCTKSTPKDIVGGVENGNGYVSGFVYTADGKPADGAVVRITPVDYVPSIGLPKKTSALPCTTDIHGHYAVFTRIDSGVYNMEALRDTAGALLDSVKVTGDTGQRVKDAYLHSLGGISGISFMPGQSDTNQVRVTIYMPGTRRITKPVIGGRFTFDDVPAGRYQMIFDPTINPYHVKILDVNITPGHILDLDTVFLYGDSITGLPKVSAGNDTVVSINDTIRLHGRAMDPYGRIVKLEWDIGATGHFVTTISGDTTIVAGTTEDTLFKCVLRATDNDGNMVCDTVQIPVFKDPPICLVGANDSAYVGDTTYLVAHMLDKLGTITKVEWDIGATGRYTVCPATDVCDKMFVMQGNAGDVFSCILRVTDDDGNVASDTARIRVFRAQPAISLNRIDAGVSANEPITFALKVSNTHFPIVMYKWDYESDGIWDDSGADASAASHSYTSPGVKTITCRAWDRAGNICGDTMTILVATEISGFSSTVVTLAEKNSPYRIKNSLNIPEGATLILEAGSVLRIDLGQILNVYGTIVARGTPSKRILITTNAFDTTSRWGDMYLVDKASCSFSYCDFQYGGSAANLIGYGLHDSLVFDNCTIRSMNLGIRLRQDNGISCAVSVQNCLFTGNGDALDVSGGGGAVNAVIEKNRFLNNGNGIIISSGFGTLSVSGNEINGCYGTSIFVSGVSATITGNSIVNGFQDGITISSNPISSGTISGTISHNIITGNGKSSAAIAPPSHFAGIQCLDFTCTISDNIITGNNIGVICTKGAQITQNNIFDNKDFDFLLPIGYVGDMSVPGNWWGTTDTSLIETKIFDFSDDPGLGRILFSPVLTSPVPGAGPQ